MPAEKEFEFDPIFALPRDGADEGAVPDVFYEAGCGDAAIGLDAPGAGWGRVHALRGGIGGRNRGDG